MPREAPRASAQLRGNERLRKENDLLAAYLRRTFLRSSQADLAASPSKARTRRASRPQLRAPPPAALSH